MSFGSSVGLCWQSHFASEKLGSTEKALSHSSRHVFCLKYKKYSAKLFPNGIRSLQPFMEFDSVTRVIQAWYWKI